MARFGVQTRAALLVLLLLVAQLDPLHCQQQRSETNDLLEEITLLTPQLLSRLLSPECALTKMEDGGGIAQYMAFLGLFGMTLFPVSQSDISAASEFAAKNGLTVSMTVDDIIQAARNEYVEISQTCVISGGKKLLQNQHRGSARQILDDPNIWLERSGKNVLNLHPSAFGIASGVMQGILIQEQNAFSDAADLAEIVASNALVTKWFGSEVENLAKAVSSYVLENPKVADNIAFSQDIMTFFRNVQDNLDVLGSRDVFAEYGEGVMYSEETGNLHIQDDGKNDIDGISGTTSENQQGLGYGDIFGEPQLEEAVTTCVLDTMADDGPLAQYISFLALLGASMWEVSEEEMSAALQMATFSKLDPNDLILDVYSAAKDDEYRLRSECVRELKSGGQRKLHETSAKKSWFDRALGISKDVGIASLGAAVGILQGVVVGAAATAAGVSASSVGTPVLGAFVGAAVAYTFGNAVDDLISDAAEWVIDDPKALELFNAGRFAGSILEMGYGLSKAADASSKAKQLIETAEELKPGIRLKTDIVSPGISQWLTQEDFIHYADNEIFEANLGKANALQDLIQKWGSLQDDDDDNDGIVNDNVPTSVEPKEQLPSLPEETLQSPDPMPLEDLLPTLVPFTPEDNDARVDERTPALPEETLQSPDPMPLEDLLPTLGPSADLTPGSCLYDGDTSWSFCIPVSFAGECPWPYYVKGDEYINQYWNYGHPERPRLMQLFKRIVDTSKVYANGPVISWWFDCYSTITLELQYEDYSMDTIQLKDAESVDLCDSLRASAYQMAGSSEGFTSNCAVFMVCTPYVDVFECNLQVA